MIGRARSSSGGLVTLVQLYTEKIASSILTSRLEPMRGPRLMIKSEIRTFPSSSLSQTVKGVAMTFLLPSLPQTVGWVGSYYAGHRNEVVAWLDRNMIAGMYHLGG